MNDTAIRKAFAELMKRQIRMERKLDAILHGVEHAVQVGPPSGSDPTLHYMRRLANSLKENRDHDKVVEELGKKDREFWRRQDEYEIEKERVRTSIARRINDTTR